MNPSVIISKRYTYLLAEINWLLIFINFYTQPAVFITFSLLKTQPSNGKIKKDSLL